MRGIEAGGVVVGTIIEEIQNNNNILLEMIAVGLVLLFVIRILKK